MIVPLHQLSHPSDMGYHNSPGDLPQRGEVAIAPSILKRATAALPYYPAVLASQNTPLTCSPQFFSLATTLAALLESHNVLLDPERRQAYLRAATEKLTRLKASARFSGVRRQNEEVLSRVARGLSAHDPDVRWTALMQLSLIGEDPEAYSAQLASLVRVP